MCNKLFFTDTHPGVLAARFCGPHPHQPQNVAGAMSVSWWKHPAHDALCLKKTLNILKSMNRFNKQSRRIPPSTNSIQYHPHFVGDFGILRHAFDPWIVEISWIVFVAGVSWSAFLVGISVLGAFRLVQRISTIFHDSWQATSCLDYHLIPYSLLRLCKVKESRWLGLLPTYTVHIRDMMHTARKVKFLF